MNTSQLLAERRTGIGGSDIAPLLGLSRWKTPLQLYMEKCGEADEQPDTPAMWFGRNMEPVIRARYELETGHQVEPSVFCHHAEHNFMLAHLDGIATLPGGERRVLEIKTARHGGDWGEEGSADIPQEYALQVQHYLFVTGMRTADVAVLIAGSDFRIYHVPADAELQSMILEAASAFWRRVQSGNPPPPMTSDDCLSLWRIPQRQTAEATGQALADAAELANVKRRIGELETRKEELETAIKSVMADAEDLMAGGRVVATWRATKGRESFDAKALKAAHPDIYRQFTRTGQPSRRFVLKGGNDE